MFLPSILLSLSFDLTVSVSLAIFFYVTFSLTVSVTHLIGGSDSSYIVSRARKKSSQAAWKLQKELFPSCSLEPELKCVKFGTIYLKQKNINSYSFGKHSKASTLFPDTVLSTEATESLVLCPWMADARGG